MASDLASEVKLIFRFKGSKGWLCTLMASRGLTESIFKSLLKKLGCSLPPIFSIILGNILFFFLTRAYQQQLLVFVFVPFCFCFFFGGMVLLAVYGFIRHVSENFPILPFDSIYGLHRLYLKRHSVCSNYQV